MLLTITHADHRVERRVFRSRVKAVQAFLTERDAAVQADRAKRTDGPWQVYLYEKGKSVAAWDRCFRDGNGFAQEQPLPSALRALVGGSTCA